MLSMQIFIFEPYAVGGRAVCKSDYAASGMTGVLTCFR